MSQKLANEAYQRALALFAKNHPHERLTSREMDAIFAAVVDLIGDGMTEPDDVAAFAIDRARRRKL